MEDRELLELAAKAIGISGEYVIDRLYGNEQDRIETGIHLSSEACWNPLTDDGDALRLAVKLNIHVLRFEYMTTASPVLADWGCDERDDGDPYAATRRAVVRAAAEIGKQIQNV